MTGPHDLPKDTDYCVIHDVTLRSGDTCPKCVEEAKANPVAGGTTTDPNWANPLLRHNQSGRSRYRK